jgi:hypothetical protein
LTRGTIVAVQFRHIPAKAKPRWRLPVFAVVALVVLGCLIAVAVALAQSAPDFADVPGPDLTRPAREEIERADCAKLAQLRTVYAWNADSEEGAWTAMQLVNKQVTKLGCYVPADAPFPPSN